MTWVHTVI